jgi:putative aldouronate transport system substrate-binding protein
MGTKSMDEWDAFVEQLHSMGIDECISAKQSALDRYNAR